MQEEDMNASGWLLGITSAILATFQVRSCVSAATCDVPDHRIYSETSGRKTDVSVGHRDVFLLFFLLDMRCAQSARKPVDTQFLFDLSQTHADITVVDELE